jgi:hypothetical protein
VYTRPFSRFGALLLTAAFLAACGGAPAAQPQPTMPASMPGMDHSQMGRQTPIAATPQTDGAPAPTMTGDMPGMGQDETGGHDMAPVDASTAPAPGSERRGGQLLEPVLVDGVKEFALTTSIIRWNRTSCRTCRWRPTPTTSRYRGRPFA